MRLIQMNVASFDVAKHNAVPVVGDAKAGLEELSRRLDSHRAPAVWGEGLRRRISDWTQTAESVLADTGSGLPSDAQVIGGVNRAATPDEIIVCAAGGLPGELHKLWRASQVGGYHLEYGYSCMGYEIAGGLGVKMAHPDRAVTVMVGDGSYLMMNSEIATSVMLGFKLTIVVLNNGGFGCIDRLQRGTGGQSFNNLLSSTRHETLPALDFAAHAASLGATSEKVTGIAELEAALDRARGAERTYVIVIDTDPTLATEAGGHWWDVAIPEVSESEPVRTARSEYEQATKAQKVGE